MKTKTIRNNEVADCGQRNSDLWPVKILHLLRLALLLVLVMGGKGMTQLSFVKGIGSLS